MSVSKLSQLNNELNDAPELRIEVLTETELETVTGGYAAELIDDGCSCTRSSCHIDGVDDGD